MALAAPQGSSSPEEPGKQGNRQPALSSCWLTRLRLEPNPPAFQAAGAGNRHHAGKGQAAAHSAAARRLPPVGSAEWAALEAWWLGLAQDQRHHLLRADVPQVLAGVTQAGVTNLRQLRHVADVSLALQFNRMPGNRILGLCGNCRTLPVGLASACQHHLTQCAPWGATPPDGVCGKCSQCGMLALESVPTADGGSQQGCLACAVVAVLAGTPHEAAISQPAGAVLLPPRLPFGYADHSSAARWLRSGVKAKCQAELPVSKQPSDLQEPQLEVAPTLAATLDAAAPSQLAGLAPAALLLRWLAGGLTDGAAAAFRERQCYAVNRLLNSDGCTNHLENLEDAQKQARYDLCDAWKDVAAAYADCVRLRAPQEQDKQGPSPSSSSPPSSPSSSSTSSLRDDVDDDDRQAVAPARDQGDPSAAAAIEQILSMREFVHGALPEAGAGLPAWQVAGFYAMLHGWWIKLMTEPWRDMLEHVGGARAAAAEALEDLVATEGTQGDGDAVAMLPAEVQALEQQMRAQLQQQTHVDIPGSYATVTSLLEEVRAIQHLLLEGGFKLPASVLRSHMPALQKNSSLYDFMQPIMTEDSFQSDLAAVEAAVRAADARARALQDKWVQYVQRKKQWMLDSMVLVKPVRHMKLRCTCLRAKQALARVAQLSLLDLSQEISNAALPLMRQHVVRAYQDHLQRSGKQNVQQEEEHRAAMEKQLLEEELAGSTQDQKRRSKKTRQRSKAAGTPAGTPSQQLPGSPTHHLSTAAAAVANGAAASPSRGGRSRAEGSTSSADKPGLLASPAVVSSEENPLLPRAAASEMAASQPPEALAHELHQLRLHGAAAPPERSPGQPAGQLAARQQSAAPTQPAGAAGIAASRGPRSPPRTPPRSPPRTPPRYVPPLVHCPAATAGDAPVSHAPALLQASAPPELCCPLTKALFGDPVLAADGHTYERGAIVRWLAQHGTSPSTLQPLAHQDVVPNLLIRSAVDAFRSMQCPAQY